MLNELKLLVVANDSEGIYNFFDKLDLDEFASSLSTPELQEFKELISESKNILLNEQRKTQAILNKLKSSKNFL